MLKLTPVVLVLCAACSTITPDGPLVDPGAPTTAVPVAVNGSSEEDKSVTEAPTMLEELEWLVATWRVSRSDGFIEETWIPAAGGAMLGIGRTVTNGRMTSFEYLRIEQRGDRLVYVAQPGGRAGTEFEMADRSDQHVLFENPDHDFPKWLLYERREDGSVMATAGNDESQLEFDYARWP
ncbi:MAG: hypothetical protein ACI80N_000635 [Gammaproteobacteria bacterium]|jgi:hypothetical protein